MLVVGGEVEQSFCRLLSLLNHRVLEPLCGIRGWGGGGGGGGGEWALEKVQCRHRFILQLITHTHTDIVSVHTT